MTKEAIYQFLRQHKFAVIATSSPGNQPEAAVIGIAVTEELEVVFDTLNSSRKYQNLVHNAKVALVIRWDNETTVQLEGEAIELTGAETNHYKETYFSVFPDGRQRAETWPGLVHFVVKPSWLRYSNFSEPPVIEEIDLKQYN
jgi:pyridoxine/pyridoxamine 5'-phosphate oxidase